MDARQWLMRNRIELYERIDSMILRQHGAWNNSYMLDSGWQSITTWISASDGLWRHNLHRTSTIEPHAIGRLRIRWDDFNMTTVDVSHDWNITIERQFNYEGHSWYHIETNVLDYVLSWLATCPAYRKAAAQKQTAVIKDELISAALHPRRIEQWLEQGVELEAM